MGLSAGGNDRRGPQRTQCLPRRLFRAIAAWLRPERRRRGRSGLSSIAAALFGLVVFAALGVMVEQHQTHRIERVAFSRSTFEAASAEVQFARALASDIRNQNPAAQPGFDYNAPITVAALQAAGYLPPGYQPTNMFGETIIGYLGPNGVGVVTYTGQPSQAVLTQYGIHIAKGADPTTNLVLNPEMLAEARDAAVVAIQDPELVCGTIQGENFQALAGGYAQTLDNLGISAQAPHVDHDYHAAILINAEPNQLQQKSGGSTNYNGFTPD